MLRDAVQAEPAAVACRIARRRSTTPRRSASSRRRSCCSATTRARSRSTYQRYLLGQVPRRARLRRSADQALPPPPPPGRPPRRRRGATRERRKRSARKKPGGRERKPQPTHKQLSVRWPTTSHRRTLPCLPPRLHPAHIRRDRKRRVSPRDPRLGRWAESAINSATAHAEAKQITSP